MWLSSFTVYQELARREADLKACGLSTRPSAPYSGFDKRCSSLSLRSSGGKPPSTFRGRGLQLLCCSLVFAGILVGHCS